MSLFIDGCGHDILKVTLLVSKLINEEIGGKRKDGPMTTNNLFLDAIIRNAAIVSFQDSGCFIRLSFADKPPWAFR